MNIETKSITVGEYVKESETWLHSQERLDLLKECADLVMLEVYAEAHGFLTEYAENLTAEGRSTIMNVIVEAGSFTNTSIPDIAAKAAARKQSILAKIIALIKAMGRVISAALAKLIKYFINNREKRIASLETKAANLLESIEKSAIPKIAIPDLPSEPASKAVLIRGVFDSECRNIQQLNDRLRHSLSSDDYKKLKENEGWLAPKIEVRTVRVVDEIDDLMDEIRSIICKIDNLESSANASANIVNSLDSLSSKIKGMIDDTRNIRLEVKIFQKKSDVINTANAEMSRSLDNLAKRFNIENTDTVHKSDAEYGRIFTALSGSITELRTATASVLSHINAIIGRIDTAIVFQEKVITSIMESIKK